MDSRDSDGTQPGIDDTQSVLGAIQRLCDEHDRLRTAASVAERECTALRDEVTALRGQLDMFRRERSQITQALTDRLNGVNANVPPRLNGPPREAITAQSAPGAPAVSGPPARPSPFSRT
jgi:hypothetical protein